VDNYIVLFLLYANILSRKKVIIMDEKEQVTPSNNSTDSFYSESNMKALDESAKELEEGKSVTKTLDELELMEND
jgi:hypothetical protein